MWTSCVSQISTKIGIEFFYIEMSIVNIYWMTPSYMSEKMFVMWWLGKCELTHGHDLDVV
jgi:hypothetical protein